MSTPMCGLVRPFKKMILVIGWKRFVYLRYLDRSVVLVNRLVCPTNCSVYKILLVLLNANHGLFQEEIEISRNNKKSYCFLLFTQFMKRSGSSFLVKPHNRCEFANRLSNEAFVDLGLLPAVGVRLLGTRYRLFKQSVLCQCSCCTQYKCLLARGEIK